MIIPMRRLLACVLLTSTACASVAGDERSEAYRQGSRLHGIGGGMIAMGTFALGGGALGFALGVAEGPSDGKALQQAGLVCLGLGALQLALGVGFSNAGDAYYGEEDEGTETTTAD